MGDPPGFGPSSAETLRDLSCVQRPESQIDKSLTDKPTSSFPFKTRRDEPASTSRTSTKYIRPFNQSSNRISPVSSGLANRPPTSLDSTFGNQRKNAISHPFSWLDPPGKTTWRALGSQFQRSTSFPTHHALLSHAQDSFFDHGRRLDPRPSTRKSVFPEYVLVLFQTEISKFSYPAPIGRESDQFCHG